MVPLVTRGLAPLAEVVDAMVDGARSTTAAAGGGAIRTLTAAGVETAAGVKELVHSPGFLLLGPTPEVNHDTTQLKSLLKAASATAAEAQEISCLCSRILESTNAKVSKLPTHQERCSAAEGARGRLRELRSRVLEADHHGHYHHAPSPVAALAHLEDGYDLGALDSDLASLSEISSGLRYQHEMRLSRLRSAKKKALELVEGHGEREARIMDVLSFVITYSLRNQRCFDSAHATLKTVAEQEAVLRWRYEDDSRIILQLREAFSSEATAARRLADAKGALLRWREGVFEGLDEVLVEYAGESAAARGRLEYMRALQHQTATLQRLREEIVRLADEVRSGLEPLRLELLEVDTRLAVATWSDNLPGDSEPMPAVVGGLIGRDARHLSTLREELQKAIDDRSRCMQHLSQVVDEMDSRLAQRLWHDMSPLH